MPAATLLRFEPTERPCATCDRSLERPIYGYPEAEGTEQAMPLIVCRSCRIGDWTSLDGRRWTFKGMDGSDGVALHYRG
jgi:hypothetical protein